MTPSNARQVIFYSPTVISYILQRRACFRRPAVDLLGNPNRPPPQIPNPNEETTMTSAGGICLHHQHHEGGGHGFLPFASRRILGSVCDNRRRRHGIGFVAQVLSTWSVHGTYIHTYPDCGPLVGRPRNCDWQEQMFSV